VSEGWEKKVFRKRGVCDEKERMGEEIASGGLKVGEKGRRER